MSPSSLLAGLGAAALLLAGMPGRAAARTLVVHEGESIRAALARASPGDRIEVMPGVYREGAPGELNALTVTLDGIELVGRSRTGRPVVLENAGGQSFGIWVSPPDSAGAGPEADPEHPPCGLDGSTLRGFALHGFTLRGFEVHGVHLACVDGFSLTANVSDGNAVYGLFPVVSRDGIIAANEAMNTPKDAAIYVGQSDRVLIAGNSVHDSLLGIEVENSRRCAVVGNEVFANSFGIFVDLLPFLERSTQESTKVAKNDVHDNGRANTADPSDILGVLPAGIGILVVAGDTTTVSENRVERNPFTGIAVTSLCTGLALQGQTCDGLDIDPFPDRNRIVRNVLLDNGTVPVPDPTLDALRGDLAWDGTGNGNCWSRNRFATSSPPALPRCED